MFFVIVFLFSLTTIAQASLGDGTLKIGSRGPDVVELQTKLNSVGFDVGTADGIFGNMTKQSVINFQRENSLVGDGIVGPLTVKTLNSTYIQKQSPKNVDSIIATAKQYLGVKYQWGGTTPQTGFDCSGYVSYVFSQNGISLPRVSRDQYTVGNQVAFADLQAGDLVFFSFAGNGIVSHVGIYLGEGQFINASSSKGVTVYEIGSYWKSVYVGARRVL
ncbi:hydrolase [Desulfosporosinus fructosivorans]|uniref:Hydrolase n=2 Tax=Desulfosporosinus fructosivorans TaxID=2018669 RepID=A0A4Z0R3Z4_9FIRM|nr:hydrolase [Desulfosporosinus fructosivorans]